MFLVYWEAVTEL